MIHWTLLAGSSIALVFYLTPLALVIGSVALARRVYRRKDRRSPLSKDLLRGPGHTLKERLDEAKDDLTAYLAAVIPIPLFFLASWAVEDRFNHRETSFPVIFILVIGVAAAFFIVRIFGLIKDIRNYSLGYEAEMAVGQELNQLMTLGYHVFHDVSGEHSFNIDHVVVGPAGVFAVETKGRPKPLKDGKPEYRVELRDERLFFPGWSEVEPLVQASRNAQWLSKWLSSATGESVQVHPVLALPGWFIDRKTKSGVFVFNGSNSPGTLGKWRPAFLSAQMINRCVHQLEARCRDVSPTAH
jgi:hypothetical protein